MTANEKSAPHAEEAMRLAQLLAATKRHAWECGCWRARITRWVEPMISGLIRRMYMFLGRECYPGLRTIKWRRK